MINLGTSTTQDFALGDNLVERIDLGDTTIFDPYTTLTGTLPLSFNARVAGALKNYRMYGDSDGAGVQTENLIADIIDNGNIDGSGKIILYTSANTYRLLVAPIISGKTYTICSTGSISTIYGIYDSLPEIGSISYDTSRHIVNAASETFVAPITGYIAFREDYNITTYMLIEGSTAPTTYIPFGYKIPISNSDGTNTSNYDLFLGDSKLYEDEYLDYGEQKVYKDISGTLTPTDPPVPLPAIQAYQGENTLSSTETVGEVSVKGRISEITS